MDDFLDKMKKSLEEGKFNSEIADRINEIGKKADEFAEGKTVEEMKSVVEGKFVGETQPISEDEIKELNSDHEDRMEMVRLQNEIGIRIAHIMNVDREITNHMVGLKNKIQEVRQNYGNHKEKFVDLFSKLNEIENKYNVIKF